MAVTVAVGATCALGLKFLDSSGNPVTAPTTGGTLSRNTSVATGNLGKVYLDPNGATVHYEGTKIGTDTLSFSIDSSTGTLTATETVNVVATTAASVSFDETTFATPDPAPPPLTAYS